MSQNLHKTMSELALTMANELAETKRQRFADASANFALNPSEANMIALHDAAEMYKESRETRSRVAEACERAAMVKETRI